MSENKVFTLAVADILVDAAILARPYRPSRVTMMLRLANEWPPIRVTLHDGKWLLLDGYHRLKAAQLLERTFVTCQAIDVPRGQDLAELVIALNAAQKPRSGIAHMAAKLMTLHPDWTDPDIAKFLHAHVNTLAGLRRKLEESGQIPRTIIQRTRQIVTANDPERAQRSARSEQPGGASSAYASASQSNQTVNT